MESTNRDSPSLSVVIQDGDLKQEFTLSDDLFGSFEEACLALQQFIQSYRNPSSEIRGNGSTAIWPSDYANSPEYKGDSKYETVTPNPTITYQTTKRTEAVGSMPLNIHQ